MPCLAGQPDEFKMQRPDKRGEAGTPVTSAQVAAWTQTYPQSG